MTQTRTILGLEDINKVDNAQLCFSLYSIRNGSTIPYKMGGVVP